MGISWSGIGGGLVIPIASQSKTTKKLEKKREINKKRKQNKKDDKGEKRIKRQTKPKLYGKLLSIGFKNTVLKKHKELITDPILEENYNEVDAIKYLWRQWCSFSSLQEQEEENTIEILKLAGFTTKVATKMSKILDSLWGHYKSDTIVDIAIEYLNGVRWRILFDIQLSRV